MSVGRAVPGRAAGRWSRSAGSAAALLIVAAAAACGGDGSSDGSADAASRSGPGTGLHGTVLPEPRPKGDFTLTATDGETFRFREETDGDVTLLFFGYTHCPTACPVQMATLGAAYGKLSWDVRDEVRVLFVTTDPARDTLARLRSWLDNFHESFVGLRGSREEVNAIMESYGLPPSRIDSSATGPGSPGDGYTVGHAAHVLVFTPDGRLRMTYPTGTRQTAWVEDLRKLAREGGAALPGVGTSAGDGGAAGGSAGSGAAGEGGA